MSCYQSHLKDDTFAGEITVTKAVQNILSGIAVLAFVHSLGINGWKKYQLGTCVTNAINQKTQFTSYVSKPKE